MSRQRYSLGELAEKISAQLIGDPDLWIDGVNTLEEASSQDVSFLANPRYVEAMKNSKAGVICIDFSTSPIQGKNYLVSDSPSRTFQTIAELLHLASSPSCFEGIHPTAIIAPTAQIGQDVTIAPYAVIDAHAVIGDRSSIGPHVYIGPDVHIGTDCILHAHAVVREKCILKNRVILQPAAVIGSCGFGYTFTPEGRYEKLEQLGIVVLEDDVEIGSHTAIDRSRFRETKIGKGTKIDNLCQIAHNVHVGQHNAIAAQTGIAGSATTGNYVMLGGQVGVLGHVDLGDQVMVATRGGVSKSLSKGKYRGSPAIPLDEYNRQKVHVRKLDQYVKKIKELEERLSTLESRSV